MKKIFISGPYSGNTEENVNRAIGAGEFLREHGALPFIPHLYHFWDENYQHDYEYWMEQCLEWLKICDAVLRLDGESSGADREVELANRLGIPVFYYAIDVLKFLNGNFYSMSIYDL